MKYSNQIKLLSDVLFKSYKLYLNVTSLRLWWATVASIVLNLYVNLANKFVSSILLVRLAHARKEVYSKRLKDTKEIIGSRESKDRQYVKVNM